MKAHPAEVKVLTASISPEGIPLTTFQLRYWRGIHSELMTHRVFSRNAGSSRARPSKAIIEQVRHDPWGPLHWGANQPGMQADKELNGLDTKSAQAAWRMAAREAAKHAELLVEVNAHKQIANRLLEPFTYIDVVLTATDFANWFALRDHRDADPTIRDLAAQMKDELVDIKRQELKPGEWHLPYVSEGDYELAYHYAKVGRITRDEPRPEEILTLLKKASAARCARVSYKLHDGSKTDFTKDLELFDRLLVSQPLHASPAEHQATPDVMLRNDDCLGSEIDWENPHQHGNFRGWRQFRKMLPNECVPG